MAIRIEDEYPAGSNPADASYPEGSFKNVSSAGAGDGTPYEEKWANDIQGVLQKLLSAAGITPSGSPDTVASSDYFDALEDIFSRFLVLVESGAANAYVLTAPASLDALIDNMPVLFRSTATNTGASTINVNGLGVKTLQNQDGSALTAGTVVNNRYAMAVYRQSLDLFVLIDLGGGAEDTSAQNAIINGDFLVHEAWGYTHTFNAGFTADRWYYQGTTGGAATITFPSHTLGQTAVPGNPKRYARLALDVTTPDPQFSQKIEGVETFAGQEVTVSFYCRSDVATTIDKLYMEQNFGTGGSPSAVAGSTHLSGATIGTSWAKLTATFTLASVSGKTLGSNGDDHVLLRIEPVASTAQTFDISDVQLVPGGVAPDFHRQKQADVLSQCQRYAFSVTAGYLIGRLEPDRITHTYCVQHPCAMRLTPAGVGPGVTFSALSTFSIIAGNNSTPKVPTSTSGVPSGAHVTNLTFVTSLYAIASDGGATSKINCGVGGCRMTFSAEL